MLASLPIGVSFADRWAKSMDIPALAPAACPI
jgi:hypothetical protein